MKVRRARLRYHRTRLGLTQAEVAGMVGIATSTYQWLESGRRDTARASTLGRLIQVFDVPLDDIVHADDEPEEEAVEAAS